MKETLSGGESNPYKYPLLYKHVNFHSGQNDSVKNRLEFIRQSPK